MAFMKEKDKDHPKSFTNWNFGTLFSDRNSFQERISSMSWYLVIESDGLWFNGLWFNGLWNNPILEAYEKILLNRTNDSISSPFSLQQPVSPFFIAQLYMVIPSSTPRNSLLENHRDQSVVRLWKISLLFEARTMGHSQVFIRSCTNENLTCLVIQSGKKTAKINDQSYRAAGFYATFGHKTSTVTEFGKES